MGAGRTPTKQQRELFFLQSLPEAALLSGTRSHTGREEQTATGSATFGFKPLHREMCWEESSSSEPSCSPALSQCPKIPAGLGCLIPIGAKSAPAALNAPIPVTRVKPNLDLNHLWEQGGKTDISHCQIKTKVGDNIYPHQKAQKGWHWEKAVLADAAGSHSLVPHHHPPLTRQFWGNLPLLFKSLTLPFQSHIAVRQPEPKISPWDRKREDAELFWGAPQSRKTCQEQEESHTLLSFFPSLLSLPFFSPSRLPNLLPLPFVTTLGHFTAPAAGGDRHNWGQSGPATRHMTATARLSAGSCIIHFINNERGNFLNPLTFKEFLLRSD